jgi:hypothetical protein
VPTALKDKLKELVDRSTRPISIIGFAALITISLGLSDFAEFSADKILQLIDRLKDTENVWRFFGPKIPAIAMIVIATWWYGNYKKAVLTEIDLLDQIFSGGSRPLRVGSLKGQALFPAIGYVLAATYAALILSATNITAFCLVAVLIHLTDLVGSSLALQNISLAIIKYDVNDGVGDAEFTRERRRILQSYYFDNPTLLRICIILAVTMSSLVLSIYVTGQNWNSLIYAIVATNIVAGEVVIRRWRKKRDEKLDTVDMRQEEMSRRSLSDAATK